MATYTFEQFALVRHLSDVSFNPGGTRVVYCADTAGHSDVWMHRLDSSDMRPIRVTALSDRSARRAVWSPDGSRILTTADRYGDENFHIYSVEPDSGRLHPLTHAPSARHELGAHPFRPDGKAIAYASNARSASDFDVVVQNLEEGSTRTLLSGGASYFPISWSPDGHRIIAVRHHTNLDQDLYLCDVDTGDSRCLTPHLGEVRYFPGPWGPGGCSFYVVSDKDREFLGLGLFDLATNGIEWVETSDWDVRDGDVSSDGRRLATVMNLDGYSRLRVRELVGARTWSFPDLPTGVYSTPRFSPDGGTLSLYVSRPTAPADLYMLDVERRSHRKLTASGPDDIPASSMIEPELIRYRSFDGVSVPALLYRPSSAKAPVVLSIHGGPEDQELPIYNPIYQYLLHAGIGIFAPNIRGSSGYGKSYQKLIYRDWGGDELRDLEAAALYLRNLSWVSSLGLFGASFGGFAVLSCISRLSDYWSAAVDIQGPANLISYTQTVPPAWRRFMKSWVGDPKEDAALLHERSPLTYVENVRTPLLVIQGAHDPRVVRAESDQIVERLRSLGQTVEYLVFEDEGHRFSSRDNWTRAMEASVRWLERHLLA